MKKNEESDELILVEKDGEQIRVHPLALANHKQLGWKVVGEAPAAAPEAKAEESADEKPKSRRGRGKRSKAASSESEASGE
jgi:hypothetical protein